MIDVRVQALYLLYLCEMTPKQNVPKEEIHSLKVGRIVHKLYANGEVGSEVATIGKSSSFLVRASQGGHLGFHPGASKDMGTSGADAIVRGMV